MADVATTTTINDKFVWGNKRVRIATLAFDTGDYAAGGIAVTPGQFGLASISAVLFQGASVDSDTKANVPFWNATTGKIQLFESAGDGDPMDEKPAEAMVASTLRLVVIGR